MEFVRQLYVYCLKAWNNIVDFCNEYASVAAVLGAIIAMLGLGRVKDFAKKRREKKEFRNEFVSPVKKRPNSVKMDAYINSSDNGASVIEVKENE